MEGNYKNINKNYSSTGSGKTSLFYAILGELEKISQNTEI